MIKVKCVECGKTKKVFLSRFKKYQKHFCNRKCYKKYHMKTEFTSPFTPCTTYVDGSGRARVHLPIHPRSDKYGYVLRNIVHWEYFNNTKVPEGYVVHHINKNRLDDSDDNLCIIEHSQHSKLHNPKKETTRKCKSCGCEFKIKTWRLKDSSRGQYCSQECYQKRNGKNKR